MQKTDAGLLLQEMIRQKEEERRTEAQQLKAHFQITYESLRPINLVRGAIKDFTTTPGLKEDVGGAALGMLTGFLVRKIVTGATRNPLRVLMGVLLERLVSGGVQKHAGEIRMAGSAVLHTLTKPAVPEKKS